MKYRGLQKFFHDTLIIHFKDSGGQPEFHEVVPALVPHSTLYRNQVKFYDRNRGHFIFIRNYIKYLEVTIMLCQGSTIINVPFTEIKELLSDHLTCVIQS